MINIVYECDLHVLSSKLFIRFRAPRSFSPWNVYALALALANIESFGFLIASP